MTQPNKSGYNLYLNYEGDGESKHTSRIILANNITYFMAVKIYFLDFVMADSMAKWRIT